MLQWTHGFTCPFKIVSSVSWDEYPRQDYRVLLRLLLYPFFECLFCLIWVLLPSFFFIISILMDCFFSPLYFQSVGVFQSDMSLLNPAYSRALFSYPLNHPMSFIVAFNVLTLKVNADRYVLIEIFNIHIFIIFPPSSASYSLLSSSCSFSFLLFSQPLSPPPPSNSSSSSF